MATYAIGDLQGCYDELQQLLTKIHYNPSQDQLWFTGDLINRGPKSLDCLRFVAHTPNCRTVLGNHDLHSLVAYYGFTQLHPQDTLASLYQAPDWPWLMEWLIHRPFLIYDQSSQYCLVHAGLLPAWDLTSAIGYAQEAATALSQDTQNFLRHLYGDLPNTWNDQLIGYERLRFIVNVFTRMRYCYSPYKLELATKQPPQQVTSNIIPWFKVKGRKTTAQNIVFGHWASLNCQTDTPQVFAIDSGCVWGRSLTALRLDDGQRFSVLANR